MREMGQSAWLSTSSLTLQGSEARVNAMETGIGCNDWISWSNNYSVWPVSRQSSGDTPGMIAPFRDHSRAIRCLYVEQDAQKGCPARPQ